MANILLDGDSWAGASGFWDGSEYFVQFTNASFDISYPGGQVQDGDRVAGSWDAIFVDTNFEVQLLVLVNGAVAFTTPNLSEYGSGAFDIALSEGDNVSLVVGRDNIGESDFLYGLELVIVPDADPPPPPPPPEPSPPYIVRTVYRLYMDAGRAFTSWVRTETGKLDMAEAEIEVVILRGDNELFRVPGTSPELGRVDWEITSEQAKRRLQLLGKFRVQIRADGRVVHTGFLEVV